MKKEKMPAIFIGHGSPMTAISDNRYHQAWQDLGLQIIKPKAILMISAHWNINKTAVSDLLEPRQIYDFYGFPEKLYTIRYSPSGSPELAQRVINILSPLLKIETDNGWGIDHGAWVPLSVIFPSADIPVVQLSLDYSRSAEFHYQIGRALKPLREEGVLIIGSGDMVHNLGLMEYDEEAKPFAWATDFEEKILQCIAENEHGLLIDYLKLDPKSKLAVPTPEHYLPLLYILALKEDDEKIEYLVKGITHGSISMTSFRLG